MVVTLGVQLHTPPGVLHALVVGLTSPNWPPALPVEAATEDEAGMTTSEDWTTTGLDKELTSGTGAASEDLAGDSTSAWEEFGVAFDEGT